MCEEGPQECPDERTYTINADFDEGVLNGVEYDTVPDQLQLIPGEVTTLPVMWIANAGEDTVSRWDTETNKEIARYHTGFGPPANHGAYSGPAPSRTAVDLDGNCYVANRHFDQLPAEVMKILVDDFIDRNGNNVVDTSTDINGDGTITPDEMLPMTDTNGNGLIDQNEITDERVAWVAAVGPNGGLGRCLAIDGDGDIWVGLYTAREFWKVSGADGSILGGPFPAAFNDMTFTPYGALVDRDGILWSATLGSYLVKFDTNTEAVVGAYNHGDFGSNYGIAIGRDDLGVTHVYLGGNGNAYIEFNAATETFSVPAALPH
jgi:hypothetical protein